MSKKNTTNPARIKPAMEANMNLKNCLIVVGFDCKIDMKLAILQSIKTGKLFRTI